VRSSLRAAPAYAIPAIAAAVVGAVVLAFVGVNAGRSPRVAGAGGAGTGDTVVFTATALDPAVPLGPSLDHSVAVLRERLHAVLPGVTVAASGDQVIVGGVRPDVRARVLGLAVPGKLVFSDWEANVLMPNGETAARGLDAGDATALTISQGTAGSPGEAGSGGMALYAAVRLASRERSVRDTGQLSRTGPEYYLFGRCPGGGSHCLISGPGTERDLVAQADAGRDQLLAVPQGTVVLEAARASFGAEPAIGSPRARFFVLRDDAALGGRQIADPRPGRDTSGRPDVHFTFTSTGSSRFRRATARIARRGTSVSTGGETLYQHFAVALDDRLLTVPYVDYKQYPEGVVGSTGADITGGVTRQQARDLSVILRYGPLRVGLSAR
jgi:SecD/SecF fusion protein